VSDIFVRFWGVRGSIPTPGPRTRRYGGNTSCVEVRVDDNLMIFDAGTGMRELGVHLLKARQKELTIHLFLSHPHWDHIQGFPFFGPAYVSSTTMYVYGPKGDDKNYQLLSGQMANAYFPVKFSDLGAKIVSRSFNGEVVKAGDVQVRCFGQKHPGGSVGFRVDSGDKSVVFATDSELDQLLLDPNLPKKDPEALRELPDDLVSAISGADLLIADAQYTDSEYVQKVGWGHPRATTVVDFAVQGQVRQLALTHHDPMHADRDVDLIVLECQERAEALGAELEVFGAREGITLKV
jgi:phosphoribosyl 1,2-cyclic phosphodiesterase